MTRDKLIYFPSSLCASSHSPQFVLLLQGGEKEWFNPPGVRKAFINANEPGCFLCWTKLLKVIPLPSCSFVYGAHKAWEQHNKTQSCGNVAYFSWRIHKSVAGIIESRMKRKWRWRWWWWLWLDSAVRKLLFLCSPFRHTMLDCITI